VRRTLRDRGHIVLTNPVDAARGHPAEPRQVVGAVPRPATIVIDEVHTLSGVFGSSVANVLRRLLRIAEHYGAAAVPPQFGHGARPAKRTRGP
jgi:DEAD/DEAH box helicase domain-containing protein